MFTRRLTGLFVISFGKLETFVTGRLRGFSAFAFAFTLPFAFNGVQAQEPELKLPAELAALDAQFNALKAERVTAPFEADVATLNAGYLDRLKKMIAEEKAAGNLDNILALDTEQEHVVFQQTIPGSDDEKTLPGLKTMRGIYREAHAKLITKQTENLTALVEPLAKRLAQLESDFAKADRIADAKSVRAYREKLSVGLASTLVATPPPGAPPGNPGEASTAIPAWLSQARQIGGSLKLWGGPLPGADLEVPGKAAKYKDYVSVDMFLQLNRGRVLVATRKEGDLVILDFSDISKIEVYEVKSGAIATTGDLPGYLGRDRKVYKFDGTEIFDARRIKDQMALVYSHRWGLVLSKDGSFEAFNMPGGFGPPPPQFLEGHEIVSAVGTSSLAFLTTEGTVLGWDCTNNGPVTFEGLEGKRIVEIVAGFGFRTDKGEVLLYDGQGKLWGATFGGVGKNALAKETGPWIAMKATEYFGAVQRVDGSWLGWKWDSLAPEKISTLGPVLDLDAAENKDAGILAWIELPEGIVPNSAAVPNQ